MSWVSDMLKEYPALSVAKERLEFLQDKFDQLKKENDALKEVNETLRSANSNLQTRLKTFDRENEFIESSGVLFKKLPNGNIENYAYCPTCKLAMTEFPPQSNECLICTKCNFSSPFRPNQLSVVRNQVVSQFIEELRKKKL
jgi:hypothetical protein